MKVLDSLTAEGPWALDLGAGHRLEVSRKGGGYRFDGWARIAPVGVAVSNPAFDGTPHRYITAIITEAGVAKRPFSASIRRFFRTRS